MAQSKKLYGIAGIAVTGFGAPEDIARCKEAGFAHHIIKPIDFDKLVAAINDVLLKARRRSTR